MHCLAAKFFILSINVTWLLLWNRSTTVQKYDWHLRFLRSSFFVSFISSCSHVSHNMNHIGIWIPPYKSQIYRHCHDSWNVANSHDNFKISTTLLNRFVHRNRILGNEKRVYGSHYPIRHRYKYRYCYNTMIQIILKNYNLT